MLIEMLHYVHNEANSTRFSGFLQIINTYLRQIYYQFMRMLSLVCTKHAIICERNFIIFRLLLWRCRIAPAKLNGPIPLDLNDFFFSFVTGPIPINTGSCPAWYRTLRPHIVLACRSHRVLTVCIPPPLKYVMLL